MTYARTVVAGVDVAERVAALRAERVAASRTGAGRYDSESLCRFQCAMSAAGYIEAEIVESLYGFSVRYASGLQDFGLIYSARAGQVDGTYQGALIAARSWQGADPGRRYVTSAGEG